MVGSSIVPTISLRAKCVMVQYKNKIVKPLATALIILTANAGLSPPKSTIKKRPSKVNKGAPGGCGNCSL